MRIVFIGDCTYNTGPSNVNKSLKKCLSQKIYFIKNQNKIFKIIEIILMSLYSEIIVISGISYTNQIALYIGKMFNKKMLYLMHGYYSYEQKINKMKKDSIGIKLEKQILKNVTKIIAVSENYKNFLVSLLPEYKDKITYINNGIDWKEYKEISSKKHNKNVILSMGGGRPQKNNIIICEAIRILNEEYNFSFEYLVLGDEGKDSILIKNRKYVKYLGQVSREEAKNYLKQTYIYIQNSSFEPFGLAPIEALCMGCNLLISKNVGALCILKSRNKNDIIENCNDSFEIASKIKMICENPNNKRLLEGINKEETSCEYAGNKLLELIYSL